MEVTMKQVDEEMKRSDELLSQMIPKSVASKLSKGLSPVDTCEVGFKNLCNNKPRLNIPGPSF